jgi:hypothetical protein
MILKNAVLKAQKDYFADAKTDADYMNAVMSYYKNNLHIMKMAIGGFKTELNAITLKYSNSTDDVSVLKWAGEIKKLFIKKKVIKNPDFDPVEYLAVTYIAGHQGTGNWVNIAENNA